MDVDLNEHKSTNKAIDSDVDSYSSLRRTSSSTAASSLEHSDDSSVEEGSRLSLAPYNFEPSDLKSDGTGTSASTDAEDNRLSDLSW